MSWPEKRLTSLRFESNTTSDLESASCSQTLSLSSMSSEMLLNSGSAGPTLVSLGELFEGVEGVLGQRDVFPGDHHEVSVVAQHDMIQVVW